MDNDVPMIVLETALPIKFEDSIVEAINQKPDRPESLKHLEDLPQRFQVLDNQVDQVKTFIRQNV
jgi:threonine synthase